jgi:hypothetical protein
MRLNDFDRQRRSSVLRRVRLRSAMASSAVGAGAVRARREKPLFYPDNGRSRRRRDVSAEIARTLANAIGPSVVDRCVRRQ